MTTKKPRPKKTKPRAETVAPATKTSGIDEALLAEQTVQVDVGPILEAASQLRLAERQVAELSNALKEASELVRRLQEVTLPALLAEAQVGSITLTPPGEEPFSVAVEDQVYASVSKDNMPDASKWLVEQGYGSIMRYAYTIPVDKGDAKTADHVRKALVKAHLVYEEKLAIHPQTLKAFVRESIREGRELPKAITYHVQPTATITVRK